MIPRMPLPIAVLSLLVVLVATGCASSGSESGDSVYRERLVLATESDAVRIAESVLPQFGYNPDHEVQGNTLVIETSWRSRSPFPDEEAEGIEEAQTRVIVEGRQRTDTIEGQQYYALVLLVQNETRRSGEDWRSTRNTPDFVAYANSIKEEFDDAFLSIGVRRY